MTRSHMRNGRGGACVPARTSAQRRFHPQRACPPPAKKPFPFINDVCSYQNMFVHLPMDAPLQGDTVGHAGTDPTSLHQTLLPRNLPRFSPSTNTSPQPSRAFIHRRSLCRRHATRCGGQRSAPGNIAATDVAR